MTPLTNALPALLLGVMYISLTLFLIAPLIARGGEHRQRMRCRAVAVWMVASGALLYMYFQGSPQLVPLAEAVFANLVVMLVAALLPRAPWH